MASILTLFPSGCSMMRISSSTRWAFRSSHTCIAVLMCGGGRAVVPRKEWYDLMTEALGRIVCMA